MGKFNDRTGELWRFCKIKLYSKINNWIGAVTPPLIVILSNTVQKSDSWESANAGDRYSVTAASWKVCENKYSVIGASAGYKYLFAATCRCIIKR